MGVEACLFICISPWPSIVLEHRILITVLLNECWTSFSGLDLEYINLER